MKKFKTKVAFIFGMLCVATLLFAAPAFACGNEHPHNRYNDSESEMTAPQVAQIRDIFSQRHIGQERPRIIVHLPEEEIVEESAAEETVVQNKPVCEDPVVKGEDPLQETTGKKETTEAPVKNVDEQERHRERMKWEWEYSLNRQDSSTAFIPKVNVKVDLSKGFTLILLDNSGAIYANNDFRTTRRCLAIDTNIDRDTSGEPIIGVTVIVKGTNHIVSDFVMRRPIVYDKDLNIVVFDTGLKVNADALSIQPKYRSVGIIANSEGLLDTEISTIFIPAVFEVEPLSTTHTASEGFLAIIPAHGRRISEKLQDADHALASGKDLNIFVFDTEVYANTDGRDSRSDSFYPAIHYSLGHHTDVLVKHFGDKYGNGSTLKDMRKISFPFVLPLMDSVNLSGNKVSLQISFIGMSSQTADDNAGGAVTLQLNQTSPMKTVWHPRFSDGSNGIKSGAGAIVLGFPVINKESADSIFGARQTGSAMLCPSSVQEVMDSICLYPHKMLKLNEKDKDSINQSSMFIQGWLINPAMALNSNEADAYSGLALIRIIDNVSLIKGGGSMMSFQIGMADKLAKIKPDEEPVIAQGSFPQKR